MPQAAPPKPDDPKPPSPQPPPALRLGTRGSLLARMQSQWFADQVQARWPELRVELCIIQTSGDRIADKPLRDAGGKGLFTKEIEQALLRGEVDFAVHSLKDVPVTEPLVEQEDLLIAAIPPREDPRDALVSSIARQLADLPQGAKVGTGSMRRRCQLLALRPDLCVEGVRGNVDTRLRKLREGQFDAVILAMAGLKRTRLFDPSCMSPIEPEDLLPAPGQGALGVQCRRADARTIAVLSAMHDEPTAACVDLERQVVARLAGDCHSPIAALATLAGGSVRLRAVVGGRNGNPPVIRAEAQAPLAEAAAAVDNVHQALVRQDVESLLRG